MRLVPTRSLVPGVRLGRDVGAGAAPGTALLRAGTVITERYRDALLRAGVNAVYVDDELGRGIEVPEAVSEETRREAAQALSRAFSEVEQITPGRTLAPDTLVDLNRVAAMIAADVARCGDATLALADLAASDAYTLQHSVDVAALGLLLGRKLFQQHGWVDHRGRRSFHGVERKLVRLGLGLLLHDLGKLTVPREILHKPGPLDEDEWVVVRRHPLTGLDFLPPDFVSPLVRAVVRSHHERWDGGGYPHRRAGDEIPQFARIASVADVYDAVTSERPYRGAAPAHVGVEAILAGSGTAFDPEIVAVFRRTVAPYPPGSEVELSNGWRGVVASVPPDRLDRPLVRVGFDPHGTPLEPFEVSLRDHPELAVTARPLAA